MIAPARLFAAKNRVKHHGKGENPKGHQQKQPPVRQLRAKYAHRWETGRSPQQSKPHVQSHRKEAPTLTLQAVYFGFRACCPQLGEYERK